MSAILLLAFLAAQAAPSVSLSTNPVRVCSDESSSRTPNFDIVIRNGSGGALTIGEIKAQSFDGSGQLLEQRILWQDALSLLGDQQKIAPGAEGLVYNPFAFATAGPGAHFEYEISFQELGSPAALVVRPQSCATKARLILPIKGRVLVYDGYDFLSHHRRQNHHMRADFKAFGFVDNTYRFGIDFVPIDAKGRMFRGDGSRIEDWFGWEKPVRAAADGVVAAVRDDMPDNPLGSEDFRRSRLAKMR